ncbi:MAG: signal recognition particle-docking protein FtsY [Planctomycetota bacterium]|nr:MAG: signal recognition particle-docking protein FtsY [Planctomycetota bacterium]
MFGKLFSGLKKTRASLMTGLRRMVGREQIDAAALDEFEELLYTADLGPAAGKLSEALRAANRDGSITKGEQLAPFVKQQLLELMGGSAQPLSLQGKPFVLLVCGVNGSGKTTSIAKLARHFQRQGQRVMLAACDTYRAAAVEQLTVWAERLDVPIVKHGMGADPSGLAFDAAAQALRDDVDVLIVDTAGRLHTQKNLMAELDKIRRVLGKRIDGAPHEVLLILDGTTGQNAIVQAKQFREVVDVSGLMVTKLDGTARGGAVVSIHEQLGLPVRFVGLGETPDDIEVFDPSRFIDAMFDE